MPGFPRRSSRAYVLAAGGACAALPGPPRAGQGLLGWRAARSDDGDEGWRCASFNPPGTGSPLWHSARTRTHIIPVGAGVACAGFAMGTPRSELEDIVRLASRRAASPLRRSGAPRTARMMVRFYALVAVIRRDPRWSFGYGELRAPARRRALARASPGRPPRPAGNVPGPCYVQPGPPTSSKSR
jgi:hypothetical protein